jgi:DNA polymerase-3 subunit alpha
VTLATGQGGKAPDVTRLLKDFPPKREASEQGDLWRGLGVRMALTCQGAEGSAKVELQLGDQAKFYPSNAALASWWAQTAAGTAEIIYD